MNFSFIEVIKSFTKKDIKYWSIIYASVYNYNKYGRKLKEEYNLNNRLFLFLQML